MSLETRIRDLAIRIATEINTVRGEMPAPGVSINDLVTELTSTWSSQKVTAEIATAINDLVNGAPAALDTLQELASAVEGNDTDIAAILTALSNRVRVDAVQVLTAPQQAQARTNIDAAEAAAVGDTDRDFVVDFTGGLV